MRAFLLVSTLLGISVVAEPLAAQTLRYAPYGAWRGRAVARDGLFRVQKYHWGSGITPQGAEVLNTLIPVIPTIIESATGRGEAAQDRSANRWAGWEEYAQAQREANDLLRATAELVGKPIEDPPKQPGSAAFRELDPADFLTDDPWENIPADD